jgi:hypothetical protein
VAIATLALAWTPAPAQESAIVVEARGGVAIPVGSFATGIEPGEGTEAGASFGVTIGVAGGGLWTPYLGFSQHRFGCEDAGCPSSGQYVATGFQAGVRVIPLQGSSLLPWISVGAVTTHVEAGDLGSAYAGVSDLGVGGEVGIGLHIGAASQLALNPGARFVVVGADLPDGTNLGMKYVVADLALVISF